jgi:glucosamine-6-phosphate deaminase
MTTYDQLRVHEYPDRETMGRAAADHVRAIIAAACAARGVARVIFACAPSQNEFLAALVAPPPTVAWSQLSIFHMDEYVGLSASHGQSFRHYLRGHLLDAIPAPKAFHPIRGEAPSLQDECERYSRLLREKQIDLVCMGIGENGHIAFNDPPVADFDDPELIKVVTLDNICRQQQVNDGCFAKLQDVPTHALTLTVPALFSARAISCVVPSQRKAQAVRDTLLGPIAKSCPASILRMHPNAVLHLDAAAASKLS